MAKQVVIKFFSDNPENVLENINRIRNFGEDLFRLASGLKWADVSLDEIDATTDEIRVKKIPASKARRMAQMVKPLLVHHFLIDDAEVTISDYES